jgi:glycogen operon protein
MRCFGMVLDGRAQVSGIRKTGSDATLLMVFNAHHDVVDFTLPDIPGDTVWINLLDTNQPTRDELPEFTTGDVYQVTGRSMLLFALRTKGATARVFRNLAELLTGDGEEVGLPQ